MNHLRLGAWLLEESKLSDAALRMRIAQPAASRLASEIQEILGAPLFIRAGRGIELTPEGRAFAQRAQLIMREIDDADREIEQIRGGLAGKVHVGAVTGPAIEYVLPTIRQARELFPRMEITVDVMPSDQLCMMIRAGKLDFALARLPEDTGIEQFDYQPACIEPLSLIARADHPLLDKPGITQLAATTSYDWVLPPQGSILRNTIETVFHRAGLGVPPRLINTSSFLLTLATIAHTDGIAVMAASVAQTFEEIGAIRMIKVDTDIWVEEFGIVTRAGSRLPPSSQTILDMIMDVIRA